ncbi:MBL fold metallo-hydrolase [Paenibacillus sp. 1011MAR3C5]|uniref:MBL fold metallo-hydrolase n=1 Tax=Paenibacillus sp. 1011MAR3C5 TaxID=1675787 RepID=UPI000E6C958A|nr:MBL fold metallo-hydrolase [Paenibacillus sp. 1011MAR3C5]RJE85108.1 MBL fold metallo-hydrolase [Paenibacillus sp. 1011MAR3C5]
MNQVYSLPITVEHGGPRQTITPVILRDDRHMVLVDCGYPGFVPLLEEAAGLQGLSLQHLTHVFVTHHDMDHIGALAELQRAYSQAETVTYELEALYVAGKRKSLRLIQAEASLEGMAEEARPQAEGFIAFLNQIEPALVHRTVADGTLLPWCRGTEVVHTPGHMPGHTSLFVRESGTMIAGDAVVIEADGRLGIANPQYTMDMEAALSSVERMLTYPIRQLICYHGGLFQGDARAALIALLQEYGLTYSE